MFYKSHIALTAALTLAVAHDIKIQIQAYKAAQLYLKAYDSFQEANTASEEYVESLEHKLENAGGQIQYLCHMLNEHGIEVDEFDLIALNFDN